MEEFGFADVLSVEAIIGELLRNDNRAYGKFVEEREQWCAELFRAMQGQ